MVNYYRVANDTTGQTLAAFQSNGEGKLIKWFNQPSSQKVWAEVQELLFTEALAANV